MKNIFLISILLIIFATNCKNTTVKQQKTENKTLTYHQYPQKIQKSIIYEVNVRQYSPEGTLVEFEKHLPRLKELGVEILWFMPIQPIGVENRKGDLGSYYAVRDYTAVNQEFGTLEDFKRIVKEAHELGMIVILDWVANHSAWDNVWVKQHPDWYSKDDKGNIVSPVPDWTDVADFNYNNPHMRQGMIEAMKYWVDSCDIDGFRCDVAMMVPTDFWEQARPELEKNKKLFMLAEAEEVDLMQSAFDMHYSWDFYHTMVDIAHNKKKAADLHNLMINPLKNMPQRAIPMYFTSNHDENSWNGTDQELYNGHQDLFTVLTYCVPGIPLIYSGQEACNNTRLRFFYKDTIDWKECQMTDLYKKLAKLKQNNSALWNKPFGADIEFVNTGNNDILAFVRKLDTNTVVCFFNMSDNNVNLKLSNTAVEGVFTDFFEDKQVEFTNSMQIEMNKWSFKVFVK